MVYYVANIVLTALLYFALQRNPKIKNGHRAFCVTATIQWILFVGLRNYEVFSDNLMYEARYLGLQHRFWESIIPARFSLSGEWGYDTLAKLIYELGVDFRGYIFIHACIYVGLFGRMVYRCSQDAFSSILIFATLMIFTAFCPLRQAIAVAISGMLGYDFLTKNNYVGFLICVALGMLFHTSAILMVSMLFMKQWRYFAEHPMLVALVIILEYVVVIASPAIVRRILSLTGGEDYEYYATNEHVGANTILFSVMYYALYFLTAARRRFYDRVGEEGLAALMMICFILPMAMMNSNIVRMTYYFMPLVAMLLPEFYRSFDSSWGGFYRVSSYIAFAVAGVVFTAARAGVAEYIPFFFQI